MARSSRRRLQKKFLYFFLNGKLHKVLSASRAKDQLVAWCYKDRKRVLYSYSQVRKNMEEAYTVVQVAEMLGRHRVTIQDYILDGKIITPEKLYPIGNPDSDWYKYMFSQKDILDLHEFLLESGHTQDLPSRAELLALLKNNLILYTKTEDNRFVPVWKAE